MGLWPADFPCSAPDLWLTGDHFVGKLSAIGQPTRPTLPSVPFGPINKLYSMYIHGLRGWNGRLWLRAAVRCSLVREHGIGLRPRLNDGPASDAQRRCSSIIMRLAALYISAGPLAFSASN